MKISAELLKTEENDCVKIKDENGKMNKNKVKYIAKMHIDRYIYMVIV